MRGLAKLNDIQHSNLRLVEGDVADATAVQQAMQGQDAILSALGSRSLKKNPTLVEGVCNIVQTMEKSGTRRLVYELALGVGDSRKRINFVLRYIIIPLVLRNAIVPMMKLLSFGILRRGSA